MFIDIHCHLEMCKGVENIVREAREKGVGIIISNGVNFESNRKVLEMAEKYKEVKAALGIYPIDGLKMSDSGIDAEIEFIRQNKDKIIAIGEVGMDLKESSEISKQEENFVKFINLAKELGKPIIVHSRKAEEECINILEKMMVKKVVMHCFSGSFKLIKKIAENSWFLSVPTNVNYSAQFQQLVKEVPISNLLCETDSPFLHPLREQNNSPKNVVYSYKKIAEIKNINLKELERKIEENFRKLFL